MCVNGKIRAKKPLPDEGIDAITQDGVNFIPIKYKRIGIQTKQRYKVRRADVQKLRGDIVEHKDEYDITDKYGIIVGFSFTKDAINHCAKFLMDFGIDIRPVETKDLINYNHKGSQRKLGEK